MCDSWTTNNRKASEYFLHLQHSDSKVKVSKRVYLITSKIIEANLVHRGRDQNRMGYECLQLLVFFGQNDYQPQSRAPKGSCLGPPGVQGRPWSCITHVMDVAVMTFGEI